MVCCKPSVGPLLFGVCLRQRSCCISNGKSLVLSCGCYPIGFQLQALTQRLDGKANNPVVECKVLFTSGMVLAAKAKDDNKVLVLLLGTSTGSISSRKQRFY